MEIFFHLIQDDLHQSGTCFYACPSNMRRNEKPAAVLDLDKRIFSLIGSADKTSRPAAAISPFTSASYRSCSTTIGPRPRFRKIQVSFIFANAHLSRRFSVCSFSGAWTEIISEVVSKVLKSTCVYPSCAGRPDAE